MTLTRPADVDYQNLLHIQLVLAHPTTSPHPKLSSLHHVEEAFLSLWVIANVRLVLVRIVQWTTVFFFNSRPLNKCASSFCLHFGNLFLIPTHHHSHTQNISFLRRRQVKIHFCWQSPSNSILTFKTGCQTKYVLMSERNNIAWGRIDSDVERIGSCWGCDVTFTLKQTVHVLSVLLTAHTAQTLTVKPCGSSVLSAGDLGASRG